MMKGPYDKPEESDGAAPAKPALTPSMPAKGEDSAEGELSKDSLASPLLGLSAVVSPSPALVQQWRPPTLDRKDSARVTGSAGRAIDPRLAQRPTAWNQLVHMATLCTNGIKRSQLTRMAAALSYRTLFGLIPVMVVGLVFTATFAPRETVSGWLESLLAFAGLSQISVVQTVEIGPPDPSASSPRLDQWIQAMVDHVRSLKWEVVGFVGLATLIYAAISMLVEIEEAFNQIYHAPSGRSWTRRVTQYWTLLTLGSLFLVGSFSLPSQLEGKVNQVLSYARTVVGYEQIGNVSEEVLRARAMRTSTDVEADAALNADPALKAGQTVDPVAAQPASRADQKGTSVLPVPTAAFAAIASAEAANDTANEKEEKESARKPPPAAKTVTGVLIGAAFSLMVSFVLFLTIYCVVPNTRVQIGAASVGACMTALLWEFAKQAFALYVSSSSGYATFYGAIALLPMFLIWVYLTWLIVLFGLHVAYAMQSYRAAARQGLTQSVMVALGLMAEQQSGSKAVRSLDPAATIVVLSVVGESFSKGKSTEPSDLMERTGLDEEAAVQVLERLVVAGLLHRTTPKDSAVDSSYVLAYPPQAIALADVLRLAQEPVDQIKSAAAVRVLDSLSKARIEALGTKTLADVLA